MKIKEIYIEDYHQFQDFRLDLTYPAGHAKAGQALDKVCIIGQSGTGKTSLLLFIKKILNFLGEAANRELISGSTHEEHLIGLDCKFKVLFQENSNLISTISFFSPEPLVGGFVTYHPITGQIEKTFLEISNQYITDNYNQLGPPGRQRVRLQEHALRFLRVHLLGYLYFPVDFTNPNQVSESQEKPNDASEKYDDSRFQGIDLSTAVASLYWEKVLFEVKKYEEEYIKRSVELSKDEKLRPEFEEWLSSAHNPLKTIADNLLDDILKKFNLRVKKDASFQRKENIGLIKIETLQGEEVPANVWSTGTNQLIFSALPLFALKPKNKIILFDEPERSLYPDVQIDLTNLLTNEKLTTDCQFFFATHSPLIASSFEAWEIVELKFDPQTGKVFQEQYYRNERHVDNYFIHPKYLRWDQILTRVFDIHAEGNPARERLLMQLFMKRDLLKSNHLTPEQKQELYADYQQLAEQLNWNVENATN